MDDLKKVLQNIGGSIQELENTQRAVGRDLRASARDLKAAEKKSVDLTHQMGELRGAFAGLAALVERLWSRYEDHEARIQGSGREEGLLRRGARRRADAQA